MYFVVNIEFHFYINRGANHLDEFANHEWP